MFKRPNVLCCYGQLKFGAEYFNPCTLAPEKVVKGQTPRERSAIELETSAFIREEQHHYREVQPPVLCFLHCPFFMLSCDVHTLAKADFSHVEFNSEIHTVHEDLCNHAAG